MANAGDWLTITLWALGVMGTIVATLAGLLLWFFKRLVEQLDRQRVEIESMRIQFQLFKMETRLLFRSLGSDLKVLDDLAVTDDEVTE